MRRRDERLPVSSSRSWLVTNHFLIKLSTLSVYTTTYQLYSHASQTPILFLLVEHLPTSFPPFPSPNSPRIVISLYMIPLRRLSPPRTLLTSMSTPSSTLRQRAPLSTSSTLRSSSPPPPPHSHSHSHAGHSHSHGSHTEDTAALSSAFTSLRSPSSLDPGSRITLIGLFSNVGLTAVKGAAGYLLASSALLADAAHSGSDLVADVVTLVSYRVGRWKPTEKYPYGYGSKLHTLLEVRDEAEN